jgi:putative hemin transport protein
MNIAASLWQRYQIVQAMEPEIRLAEAAFLLGVRQAQLVAAMPGAQRLKNEVNGLLTLLAGFEHIRAVSGNQAATVQQNGRYSDFSLTEKVGLMLNPGGLDLRILARQWRSAFAVRTTMADGLQSHSVWFFDQHGDAIHQVSLLDQARADEWEQQLAAFASDQEPLDLEPVATETVAAAPDAAFDPQQFARDWLALNDVHQFTGLLHRHGLSRRQAFMHAPEGYADRLQLATPLQLLQQAHERQLPIMAFVGNRGIVQILTGKIPSPGRHDSMLELRRDDFLLQLRTSVIAEIWRIRRPTRDGIVTAVEMLDAQGETLITFFGQRAEGNPELAAWADLVSMLPQLEHDHVA